MTTETNKKKIVTGILCVIALVAVFYAGRRSAESGPYAALSTFTAPATDTNLVTDTQFAPFWKEWQILNQEYVASGSTTPQNMIYGAMEGLAQSEGDPYTVFFPPQENNLFQSDIAGNFTGIGMEIDIKNSALTVISPLKGTPAAAAGILAGDIISKINGQDTSNMTVDQAVGLIRGPAGTTVKLTIVRAGVPEAIVKTVTRQVINIPTIATSTISTSSSEIYDIQLDSFTADSPQLFQTALRSFVASGSHKLILDLRGNPGGYLDAAWDMASWFLPTGKTVVTEDFGGKQPNQVYASKGYNIFNSNLDMVILVDGGSASAAEILSAALHDYGIATLVGEKTFGKGSVQELIPITNDTSLKVTVARWLTPLGHNLSHDGIDPDYVVPITAAQVAAGTDPQMAKAVSLLQAKP
jgi:carboxyl-terminal processing protease